MQPQNITQLRSKLYKVVDKVIDTGIPFEFERNGHLIKIELVEKKSKLDNLQTRPCVVGDPDDLLDVPPGEWKPDEFL